MMVMINHVVMGTSFFCHEKRRGGIAGNIFLSNENKRNIILFLYLILTLMHIQLVKHTKHEARYDDYIREPRSRKI